MMTTSRLFTAVAVLAAIIQVGPVHAGGYTFITLDDFRGVVVDDLDT
jgi:hypothetical protein